MLLSEPPPTQGDLHFSLFGIPVRIHPMFWLVSAMLGMGGKLQLAQVLLWILVVFVSILIHELGHALVIRAQGMPTAITLYSMGGLASLPGRRVDPWKHIYILLAGPGAGFLFATLIVAYLRASGHDVRFELGGPTGIQWSFDPLDNRNANFAIHQLLFVNVMWGMVNLLPIYPLDGGQIARELFNLFAPRDAVRSSLTLSMITAGGLAIYVALKLNDMFLTIFFAYFAYASYQALDSYFGPGGGWGGRR